ncbi:MAG TPA: hypothetical protein VIM96_03165 [Pseudomonadales bacterium]
MKIKYLMLAALMLAGCANNGDVTEEEIVDDNGVISTCGDGPGLDPCIDYTTGQTYNAEASDNVLIGDDDEQLAKEAARLRSEEVTP